MSVRVAVVGLGPIGLEIARASAAHAGLKLVGAVDIDPALSGLALARLVPGAPRTSRVFPSLDALAKVASIDALALATASRLPVVAPILEWAIAHDVHVASTCEEMAAPGAARTLWGRLDRRARAAGVTLLGTGVNPGFVMDRLVLQLAGACASVERVEVERVVDAAKRRAPLRKKVGEGLTPAEFRAGVKAGRIGHVGLGASAELIARGLGWKLERYEEKIAPQLDARGRVLGVRQRGRGIVRGKELITLRLAMYVGAPDPHDRIVIAGDPPLDARIMGGTQGDRGTVGTMVNALVRLPRAPRGLITVADAFT